MDDQKLKNLQTLLNLTIKRIEFFLSKIKNITVNSDEMQYYEWFLVRNLVDFVKIAEILEIKHKVKTKYLIKTLK